ncbi:DUF6191 domain-containing protein [Nocardia sp. NPDC024068]|uniref:DUF6191 domain-containing protein n=1 Tax=Nocardia sp. NPDC024068 TaxID=3157197 RepID=UPI0034020B36
MEILFLGAPALMFLMGAAVAIRWVYLRFPSARRGARTDRAALLAAAGVEELSAFWYGTKRDELDHRAARTMLRDEESDGAPPRPRVDLDRRRAVLIAPPDHRA